MRIRLERNWRITESEELRRASTPRRIDATENSAWDLESDAWEVVIENRGAIDVLAFWLRKVGGIRDERNSGISANRTHFQMFPREQLRAIIFQPIGHWAFCGYPTDNVI